MQRSIEIAHEVLGPVEAVPSSKLGRAGGEGLDKGKTRMPEGLLDGVDERDRLGHRIFGHVGGPGRRDEAAEIEGRVRVPPGVVAVFFPLGVVEAACPPVMP